MHLHKISIVKEQNLNIRKFTTDLIMIKYQVTYQHRSPPYNKKPSISCIYIYIIYYIYIFPRIVFRVLHGNRPFIDFCPQVGQSNVWRYMELSDRGMGESGMLGRVTVKSLCQHFFFEFTWIRIEVPPWKYIYYIHQVNTQSIVFLPVC